MRSCRDIRLRRQLGRTKIFEQGPWKVFSVKEVPRSGVCQFVPSSQNLKHLVLFISHHCLLLYACRRVYELQRSACILFGLGSCGRDPCALTAWVNEDFRTVTVGCLSVFFVIKMFRDQTSSDFLLVGVTL